MGPSMSVNPAKPTPLEDKSILTSEEAAEFLGVSVRTRLLGHHPQDLLTSISGRFIRFKPADLAAFLELGSRRSSRDQRTISTASTAAAGAGGGSDVKNGIGES